MARCGAVQKDVCRKIPNTEKPGAPLGTGSEPPPAATLSPVEEERGRIVMSLRSPFSQLASVDVFGKNQL